MPFAVFKSIREVSSEDKSHCATNLLKNEPAKKWKTEEGGEKSAYVIIEMEQAYSIKGIDIGNESSAFIEVLVGGPSCARENFKEILITCSFMTPIESRNSTNLNRVRCFNREALVKGIADEKWQLLKIVCTQPFNRHVQYGLSFIKIHVEGPPDKKKSFESSGSSETRTCGTFTLREDSPDSESESKAALFNRWKVAKNKDANGISSVPRVPSPASIKKPTENVSFNKGIVTTSQSVERTASKENIAIRDRNRDSLLFTDEDDGGSVQDKRKKRLEKLEQVIVADQKRVTKETEKSKKTSKDEVKSADRKQKKDETKNSDKTNSKETLSKKSPSGTSKPSTPSTSGLRRPSSSPCTSDKPKKPKLEKIVEYKPFDQLLHGVVLVISGIQNPDRANLRNKALALGAKYKTDWDNNCTHLICAFKNTPKYNQVKGVGKIITRSWIEDCHSQKKRLPWRRYALDSAEINKPESEDEIFDESLKTKESNSSSSRKTPEDEDDVLAIYDNDAVNHSKLISSGSDTEDEIQKALASISPRKNASQTIDIFELSTEEEDYVSKKNKNDSPQTLTFFKNLKFYVSDELSATEKMKVERHIETFQGAITTSVEKANYAIANKAVTDNFKGETVTPLWILECNDSECLIPTKRYLVT